MTGDGKTTPVVAGTDPQQTKELQQPLMMGQTQQPPPHSMQKGHVGGGHDHQTELHKFDESKLAKDGDDVTVSSSEELNRGSWGGKLEFIFTCVGYAVGLGNVWRFPYLCYKNGGGAFLIPYTIMLALVGLPLFFMELSFGQFASLGPIAIWKVSPLFKGIGYAVVSISWMITIYYNVIISHVLLYLFASFGAIFKGYLPWVTCDNPWNTPYCISPTYATDVTTNTSDIVNVTSVNASLVVTSGTTITTTTMAALPANVTGKLMTPAEEYFNYYVLEITPGLEYSGGINWKLSLCLLLTWGVVLLCLIRGIQSLGKIVYFTALFPYLMLTILLIRGATLPGASKGIEFYLTPDFSRLTDARVWCDAATQIFYSLSACLGGLIAMSSYNKFNNNCLKDAITVSMINCGTSIYAGFVIFSVLGFMATEKGVEVKDVAAGGPGLAFVVYPEALSRMPVPQMWAIFFFIMMATLGFGSQFSLVESILSALTDEFPQYLRKPTANYLFRIAFILVTFLLGLPMVARSGLYLINLVDYSISGVPLLIIGFLECFVLNWIYGTEAFSRDIEMMLGKPPNIYWRTCWRFLTPIIIFLTIVFNMLSYKPPSLGAYTYPDWAQGLGWMIAMFPLALIVGVFVTRYCRRGGFKLFLKVAQPLPEWGPALSEHRFGKYSDFNDESSQLNNLATTRTTQFPSADCLLNIDPSSQENGVLLSDGDSSSSSSTPPQGGCVGVGC